VSKLRNDLEVLRLTKWEGPHHDNRLPAYVPLWAIEAVIETTDPETSMLMLKSGQWMYVANPAKKITDALGWTRENEK
jgi:hypothetical protein